MMVTDEALLVALAFFWWYAAFVLRATPTDLRARSAAGPRKVGQGKEDP
jgi:hypothetical protein